MRRHLRNTLYFFIGLLGFKANAAMAATDIFLCDPAGELIGESTDDRHKDCIDVLAWSWGASHVPGAAGGGGVTNVTDLSLTKYLDKSSPILMESVTLGKTFPKVELYLHPACCDPEMLKITLENVLISSFQTGGSSGDIQPTENVSLNFTKIEYCYTYFDAEGKPGIPDCYSYDVELNQAN